MAKHRTNADAFRDADAQATTRKRDDNPKQKYIEGTEPPRIKEIDAAAMRYKGHRDARMAALQDEIAAQAELLELMHSHGLTRYPVPDTDVEVVVETTQEKARVVKRKEATT